jgi:hypothetical protein
MSKVIKTKKEALPVITQKDANEFIRISAQANELAKQKNQLSEKLKALISAGAAIPEDGPLMLVYTEPVHPTATWKDVAFNMCVQIIRAQKKQKPLTKLHAGAAKVSAWEGSKASILFAQLEAEIPKSPRPQLSYAVNPNYQRKD